MVKRISCFISLLLISISLLFPINPQVTFIDAWVNVTNIFDGTFSGTCETLCIIFYDGTAISVTTHDEHMINIDAYELRRLLRKRGKELKDAAIMMHNHFARASFSFSNGKGDLAFLKDLRKLGFKGSFCIYVTSSKKIICEGAINDN